MTFWSTDPTNQSRVGHILAHDMSLGPEATNRTNFFCFYTLFMICYRIQYRTLFSTNYRVQSSTDAVGCFFFFFLGKLPRSVKKIHPKVQRPYIKLKLHRVLKTTERPLLSSERVADTPLPCRSRHDRVDPIGCSLLEGGND